MSLKICFYEDDKFRQFFPLSYLRPVFCMRAGILPLFRRAERFFDRPEICLSARNALSGLIASEYRDYPVNIIKRNEGRAVLFLNGRLRQYGNLPELVPSIRLATRFVSADGDTVGVMFPPGVVDEIPSIATQEPYQELYEASRNDIAEADTTASLYNRSWELVADIDREVTADFAYLKPTLTAPDRLDVHDRFQRLNPDQVYLGSDVQALPGSLIDATSGPVYIGDNTRIESQVAILGPCYIGPNSVVLAGKISGSSIGHTCRVGGEVEESVFQSYVNKYHAGFIGHAYVGSWVNFGAMTTNSDLKNNYSNIRVTIEGESIDTGSIKIGSFIGDHTKFGIGTLLTTGINIGVCCNVFGGTLIADREVPSFRWGNSSGYEEYRFDKAIKTIRRAAERRNVSLSMSEEEVLQALAEGRVDDDGVLSF